MGIGLSERAQTIVKSREARLSMIERRELAHY